jgi:hypothetical protein
MTVIVYTNVNQIRYRDAVVEAEVEVLFTLEVEYLKIGIEFEIRQLSELENARPRSLYIRFHAIWVLR